METLYPDYYEKAIYEIKHGKPITWVCQKYNIPKTALYKYVSVIANKRRQKLYGSRFNASQIFTKDEERNLANYFLEYEKFYYGLYGPIAKHLAYVYAMRNNKKVTANWRRNHCSSYDWMRAFMKRNPKVKVSRCKPNIFPTKRVYERNVDEFYDALQYIVSGNKIDESRIWNIDEMPLTSVRVSDEEETLGSAESATLQRAIVTMCCAVNATGKTIPPFYVFPINYNEDGAEDSTAPNCKCVFNPSGKMTAEIFAIYLEYFIKSAEPSTEKPHLLVVDNDVSHISLDIIDLARDNGIIFLTTPPFSSGQMMPLVSHVFDNFKSKFILLVNLWIESNTENKIKISNIPEFVKKAMKVTFTQEAIKKAFEKTGIYPCCKITYDTYSHRRDRANRECQELSNLINKIKNEQGPKRCSGGSFSDSSYGDSSDNCDEDDPTHIKIKGKYVSPTQLFKNANIRKIFQFKRTFKRSDSAESDYEDTSDMEMNDADDPSDVDSEGSASSNILNENYIIVVGTPTQDDELSNTLCNKEEMMNLGNDDMPTNNLLAEEEQETKDLNVDVRQDDAQNAVS